MEDEVRLRAESLQLCSGLVCFAPAVFGVEGLDREEVLLLCLLDQELTIRSVGGPACDLSDPPGVGEQPFRTWIGLSQSSVGHVESSSTSQKFAGDCGSPPVAGSRTSRQTCPAGVPARPHIRSHPKAAQVSGTKMTAIAPLDYPNTPPPRLSSSTDRATHGVNGPRGAPTNPKCCRVDQARAGDEPLYR